MRRGLRVVAATATLFAISGIAGAAPLTGPSPAAPVADEISPLHRALIYAKAGSHRLRDGRWNLGQAEAKLGITLSPEQR